MSIVALLLATYSDTFVDFNAAAVEAPESVAVDSHNNVYVSLSLTGEVRKITPQGAQSTFARLPLEQPPIQLCDGFPAGMIAIAFDPWDNLYINLASCSPDTRGVWKVTQTGVQTRLAAIPATSLPNGIAWHDHNLYIADTFSGIIYRTRDDGSQPAHVWLNAPEFLPAAPGTPGINGLQVFANTVFTPNGSSGVIYAVPIRRNGQPGALRAHATGVSCDDIAIDVIGDVLCAGGPFNTLTLVTPDNRKFTLLDADDGLDYPTSVSFGRGWQSWTGYVASASFPFVPTSRGTPKLTRFFTLLPGAPRPPVF